MVHLSSARLHLSEEEITIDTAEKIYIRDSSQFKTVEAIQYKQYKIDTVMHAFQRTASKTIKFVSLGEIWENHCVKASVVKLTKYYIE